nr:MAG TPA: hypothetical protein [Caudoviricetes sp.]
MAARFVWIKVCSRLIFHLVFLSLTPLIQAVATQFVWIKVYNYRFP